MKPVWVRSPGYLIWFVKPENIKCVGGNILRLYKFKLSEFNMHNLKYIISSLLRCISREKAKKWPFPASRRTQDKNCDIWFVCLEVKESLTSSIKLNWSLNLSPISHIMRIVATNSFNNILFIDLLSFKQKGGRGGLDTNFKSLHTHLLNTVLEPRTQADLVEIIHCFVI